MNDAVNDRIAEIQQRWHGWGSPVGLGLGFAFVAAGLAALAAAVKFLFT